MTNSYRLFYYYLFFFASVKCEIISHLHTRARARTNLFINSLINNLFITYHLLSSPLRSSFDKQAIKILKAKKNLQEAE